MDRTLTILLMLVGLVLVVVGVLYLALPAKSLPSFLPGHITNVAGQIARGGRHRYKRGVVALVVGLACLFAIRIQYRSKHGH